MGPYVQSGGEDNNNNCLDFFSISSPKFFGKKIVFSLAIAVGRPLQVDMASKNQTRPSCARVKVEVDLMGEFPKRINIGAQK